MIADWFQECKCVPLLLLSTGTVVTKVHSNMTGQYYLDFWCQNLSSLPYLLTYSACTCAYLFTKIIQIPSKGLTLLSEHK